MQGISSPLTVTGTHVPSGAPLCFPSFLLSLDETSSPPSVHELLYSYFTQSIRNMSSIFHSLIGFLRPGVMVFSSIEVLQRWYTYNYNNDDFYLSFDFCNSETSNPCFFTQEDILVFDFQMCF